MGQAAEILEPRIYVACLAAYNCGVLHGVWIEVVDDLEAVLAAVAAKLAASPEADAEEYAIHDYEGFGAVEIGEYTPMAKVVEIAAFLRERGELGALVLGHVNGDLGEAEGLIKDGYRGRFSSLADYLQELTEESTQIPEFPRLYIDYELWPATPRSAAMPSRSRPKAGRFTSFPAGSLSVLDLGERGAPALWGRRQVSSVARASASLTHLDEAERRRDPLSALRPCRGSTKSCAPAQGPGGGVS